MSESKKINVGDIVKLKSGGPFMTVSSINENTGKLTVVWFNTQDVVCGTTFAMDCVSLKEL